MVSCLAANVAPKFANELPYDATDASSSMVVHTISMLQGQDSSLIDECNRIGPIFLEGVDHLDDWWDRVLMQDPVLYSLAYIPQC